MLKIAIFFKDVLLFVPITFLLNPLFKIYYFLSNFNMLLLWTWKNKNKFERSDHYQLIRKYDKRLENFRYLIETRIKEEPIHYYEFGVASAASYKWWLAHATNPNSKFFGFDTFEGLPEKWGRHFDKGAFSYSMPDIEDPRANFYKGVFQETLIPFLENNSEIAHSTVKKVIHLDADLYSSTMFALSQLYRYLKPGDIIMFDEFNVANHEFRAFLDFTRSFYIELKPIAAVNNFFQVAFEVGEVKYRLQ